MSAPLITAAAVRRAYRCALRVKCANNLKNLQVACMSHLQDAQNAGRYYSTDRAYILPYSLATEGRANDPDRWFATEQRSRRL